VEKPLAKKKQQKKAKNKKSKVVHLLKKRGRTDHQKGSCQGREDGNDREKHLTPMPSWEKKKKGKGN